MRETEKEGIYYWGGTHERGFTATRYGMKAKGKGYEKEEGQEWAQACLDEADFAEEAGQDLVHDGADDDASLVRVRSLCVPPNLSISAGHAPRECRVAEIQINGAG